MKRLIACCDGTWQDALGGTGPPTNVTRLIRSLAHSCRTASSSSSSSSSSASLSPCSSPTSQIIFYDAGVGTGALDLDRLTGGGLGLGLSQNMRETYNFICANYVDGDEIVLAGFSRGAFTARSVADLVASVGMLTDRGLERFHDVFADYVSMADEARPLDKFLCRGKPGVLEPWTGGTSRDREDWLTGRRRSYLAFLKRRGYTRDTFADGTTPINIRAVAVWDTVGALGIPPAPVFGVRGSALQWRFANTCVSDRVENAFQALSLDDPRSQFKPALWERTPGNTTTRLRQVWFPGSHSDVGGGNYDCQMATIAFAWMCDQLSSIGVEFQFDRMTNIFDAAINYSLVHPYPCVPATFSSYLPWKPSPPRPWACADICAPPASSAAAAAAKRDTVDCAHSSEAHADMAKSLLSPPPPPPPSSSSSSSSSSGISNQVRPRLWGLGHIFKPRSKLMLALGTNVRRPGLFTRVDAVTNTDTETPLLQTEERIHSSVRVRLACCGLGLDDAEEWRCASLMMGDDGGKPLWKPEWVDEEAVDGGGIGEGKVGTQAELQHGCPADKLYEFPPGQSGRWQWVFVGKEKGAGEKRFPQQLVLEEEPMAGYWERYFLKLATARGETDVWQYAWDAKRKHD